MALQDTDTVENVKPALAAAKYFVNDWQIRYRSNSEPQVTSACGAVRIKITTMVLRRTRTQQLLFTNMPTESFSLPSDETYAIAVADGMGGSGRGGLASQIALRAGWELAGRTTSWVMKLEDLDSNELTERIEGFVYMLQQAFVDEHLIESRFRRQRNDVYIGLLCEHVCGGNPNRRFAVLSLAGRHDAAHLGGSHGRAGVYFGGRRAGDRRQVQSHADAMPGLRIAKCPARRAFPADSNQAINC